jgi:hypothetical protein
MRITKNEKGWLLQPDTSTEEASLEELLRRIRAELESPLRDSVRANCLHQLALDHNKAEST